RREPSRAEAAAEAQEAELLRHPAAQRRMVLGAGRHRFGARDDLAAWRARGAEYRLRRGARRAAADRSRTCGWRSGMPHRRRHARDRSRAGQSFEARETPASRCERLRDHLERLEDARDSARLAASESLE